MFKLLLLVATCLLGFSAACKVSSSAYTTSDSVILTHAVFVTEFSLKCDVHSNNFPLYAEVNERLSPVVRIGDKYQVITVSLSEKYC